MSEKTRTRLDPARISQPEVRRRLAECYRILLAYAREAEMTEASGDALDGDAPLADGTCPNGQVAKRQDTTA